MPSPVGHLLGGLAVALAAEPAPVDSRRSPEWWKSPLLLASAFLAAAPDLDLIHQPWHRSATHSLTATALVMIVTMAVTGKVTGRVQWRAVAVLGAAHATHLLLDWLGVDRSAPPGIELLWPFSRAYFISGADLFPMTERSFRTLGNTIRVDIWAAIVEVGLVGPFVALAAWIRRRRRSRGPISAPIVQRQPFA